MQKKRNIYLTISLCLLAVMSAGLFFFTQEETKPEVNRDYFKLKESEKIDQVTLHSAEGTVDLKFEKNHWRVNGKWDADMQMIKLLFATLNQSEVRRPVAASVKDSVLQRMKQNGIRVTLSEAGISKNDFMAAGNEPKTEAWFLKVGETQPYVMIIPGYRVYVVGILEMAEREWRDKRIFDFNWRNFKSLTSTYPKEPNQSFEIEMKGQYVGIKNMERTDTSKLNTYLDAVSLLFATRFVPPHLQGIDSLGTTAPAVRIEIRDIANRAYSLELFAPRRKDTEIYGRLADGEIVTFEKKIIAEIVRRRDYFLLKE